MSTHVVPGQIIGNISTHVSGPGTHVYEKNILASIPGSVLKTTISTSTSTSVSPAKGSKSTSNNNNTVLSIQNVKKTATSDITKINHKSLPEVGSIVLCRITRVQQRQLNASILVVLGNPQSSPSPSSMSMNVMMYTSTTNDDLQFQALLRKEDIRHHEKDRVVMNEMYRVGDIVRAVVISLGNERNYYISTAGDDFGVLVARSEAGNALVPVSWREMKDVVTGKGEARKVAKPG